MRLPVVAAALLTLVRVAAASEVGCPARIERTDVTATFYESSVAGACSLPTVPGAFYAAIAAPDYAGSEMCGRCLRVTGPTGTITVQIVDECPACASGHLDLLGQDTFAAIGDPLQGIVPISWETVDCDVGAGTMQLEFEASNPYYLKVQVQNHRYGVATVEMADGPLWVAMPRTEDDHFERTGDGPYVTPFAFRITDVHGQSVTTDLVPSLVNDVPLETGVQFAPCPEPAGAALVALAVVAIRSRRRRAHDGEQLGAVALRLRGADAVRLLERVEVRGA